jgi:hypothetical protein
MIPLHKQELLLGTRLVWFQINTNNSPIALEPVLLNALLNFIAYSKNPMGFGTFCHTITNGIDVLNFGGHLDLKSWK